jgi:peptide/nickel transport system permease protein
VRRSRRGLWRRSRLLIGTAAAGYIVVLAFVGPLVSPHVPDEMLGRPYEAPSGSFPLGTDALGRDVLSQLLCGGRDLLVEAIIATLLGVGTAVAIGMMMGASASRWSGFALKINDTFLALPQIVLALLVLTRIGPSVTALILIVATFHIPQTARVIRAATLGVVQEDFVQSSEAIGMPRWRILLTEVLPNITAPVFVELGIRLAISTVTLASLGYLGFTGAKTDWGRMVYENQGGLTIQPWAVLAPAIAIAVFLIGMNLVSDGLARMAAGRGT